MAGARRRLAGKVLGRDLERMPGTWRRAESRRTSWWSHGRRGRLVLAGMRRRRRALQGGGSGALGLLATAAEKTRGRVREVRLGKVKMLG